MLITIEIYTGKERDGQSSLVASIEFFKGNVSFYTRLFSGVCLDGLFNICFEVIL